jgi:Ca2+-binding RTX toxin-like protein
LGGNDTLSFASTNQAVSVNLATGAATGFTTIAGVDNVTGGSGNDTLTGDGNANVLNGNGGNDTLIGGAGNDTLIGGSGNDILVGGIGADTLDLGVGSGSDTVMIGTMATVATGVDTVNNFNTGTIGSGGDVLNIHDLLVDMSPAQGGASLTSLVTNDYISFSGSGGNANTVVSFDSNGSTTGGTVSDIAILMNVAFSNESATRILLNDNVVT